MKSDKFFIFGMHSVASLLNNDPRRVIVLRIQSGRSDHKMASIRKLAVEQGINIEEVSRQELDDLTQLANHQGVVATCTKPVIYSTGDLKNLLTHLDLPPFVLVLDGVQDPHNLGACFRSADAAGVHAIIAPKDKSVGLTPVVSKVATGAAERVPFVQVTNLVRALEELKTLGVWIFGAAVEAEQSVFQTKLAGPVAIVVGAEGKGLRRLTKEHCDELVKIPMVGQVASLNVSVATGILLFEVLRQRSILH